MEEMNEAVNLVLSLRPHPGMLQRAVYLLGSYYRTVSLDGLPLQDLHRHREECSTAAHDREWLHRTIDHEVTVSNRTITGFYTHLVQRGELWKVSPDLFTEGR